MAKTPEELAAEAGSRATISVDPDTLDEDSRKSGGAVSNPRQPRGDFDRPMSGTAQDENSPDEAVPENVAQDTGDVRPSTRRGGVYRETL